MPVQGFTTGKDITLATNTPNGSLTFGGITGFKFRRITEKLSSKQISGVNKYGYIPVGYEGSFDIDRTGPSADDYFAAADAAYAAGADPGVSTIQQTISEPNGQLTQYRFVGVVFDFEDGGEYKGDAKVTQRVTFMATDRQKVQ